MKGPPPIDGYSMMRMLSPTPIFYYHIQNIDIVIPANWVTDLDAGDVVWMVKEKAFAVVAAPIEELDNTGYLKLIKSIDPIKEERWMMHTDGTGVDHSPLIKPMPGWRAPMEPAPIKEITSKEKELCETIDALEKEIERLSSQKPMEYWYQKCVCGHEVKDHHAISNTCMLCDCAYVTWKGPVGPGPAYGNEKICNICGCFSSMCPCKI